MKIPDLIIQGIDKGVNILDEEFPLALFSALNHLENDGADFSTGPEVRIGLARLYQLCAYQGMCSPVDAFTLAKNHLDLVLDSGVVNGEVYALLGAYDFFYSRDSEKAASGFKQALDLSPGSAWVHYLNSFFLAGMNSLDKARGEALRALDINPLSIGLKALVARMAIYQRDWSTARDMLLPLVRENPGFFEAYRLLSRIYLHDGCYTEAVFLLEDAVNTTHPNPESYALLGYARAISGDADGAEQVLSQLKNLSGERFISKFWNGLIRSGIRDTDHCFRCLNRAKKERFPGLHFINIDPVWENLNGDFRLETLLSDMNRA